MRLAIMAVMVGAASAVLVVGLVRASSLLQQFLFAVDVGDVSAAGAIEAVRGCGVPLLGGALVALVGSMISDGRYAGLFSVAEAYTGAGLSDLTGSVRTLLHCRSDVLLPEMSIDACTQAFVQADSEELAVVDDLVSMNVAGIITEQHVLRRYATELDQRSREWVGG